MALLNKIFNGRRPETKINSDGKNLFEGTSWIPPTFSKDQIRLLLFHECEGRSRKLLYDSSSVKKIEANVQPQNVSNGFVQRLRRTPTSPTSVKSENEKIGGGYMEVTINGVVYQLSRPKPDSKMLGEMVFGSVAMSFRGTSSKIHTIRTPPQLMFTKVFPASHPKINDRERKLGDSLPNSLVDYVLIRQSDHLERLSSSVGSAESNPIQWRVSSCHEYNQRPSSDNTQLRPTGSLNNLLSSTGDSSSLSHSGSYHSLQRRWNRCLATSMEFGFPKYKDVLEEGELSCSKRAKLGLAVVISLGEPHSQEFKQFQTFFFSHATLIEGYMNKLRLVVEKACQCKPNFIPIIVEGHCVFQQSICDLFAAPRLPNPVWLSMMACHDQHHVLCLRFVTEFMNLIEQFDMKTSKFFVSTLLTAVLTHHLAWVPTVMPPGINPRHSYYSKHSAKWLNMLARSHPYNPLWVQLGDLYGAIGSPCKISKTVVIGKKSPLVQRFLYVLSYFIRCSEVYENMQFKPAEPRKNNLISSSEPLLRRTGSIGSLPINKKDVVCDSCLRPLDFNHSPRSKDKEMAVPLRHGRVYCDDCREVYRRDFVRNGRIFDINSHLDLEDDVKLVDRDSGISGCGSEEPLGASPSRVHFTIGDVPLEEICCPQAQRWRKLMKGKKNGESQPPCSCKCKRKKKVVRESNNTEEVWKETILENGVARARHKSEAAVSEKLNRLDSMTNRYAVEMNLPKSDVKQVVNSTAEYFRGFAWSLMSNFTDHYMSDYALQGTSETEFASRLCTDLWISVEHPVLDETIAESVCILADTDNWSVQVISNKTCDIEAGTYTGVPVSMSQSVANATESMHHLWKMKMSPEFCLMHLEDRLQEIYFKSRLMAEYLVDKSSCDIEEVTRDLGLDASDLPLLMSVASTHSSPVTCMYGVPYR